VSTHGFIPSLTSHKCGGMARSPWSGSSDRDVHTSFLFPGDLKTTYCAKPPTSPEVGLPLKGLCWVYLILHFDLPLFILLADSSCFEAWQPRKSNAARRRSTKPKWIHMPYATVYYQYIPMKSYRFAFPVGRLPVFLVRFFFPRLILNWNRGLLDIRLCP